MSESELTPHTMESGLVPSPLTYHLLTPADLPDGAPALLWLYGADGPDDFAVRTKPAFDICWADGTLPPMTVVMPHTGKSSWVDGDGENAAWESMLVDELLPHVRTTHGCGGTAVAGGISMGGAGSLRLALRHSDMFSAVAAVEPGMFPTTEWDEVMLRDRSFRRAGAQEAIYGDPIDHERFRRNQPILIAERHGAEIAANGLDIYFECGDKDMLYLHHGAEALHRRMWDIGLVHEYRSVRGADHIGRTLGPRILDALGFLGRSLRENESDPEVEMISQLLAGSHERSGFRRKTMVAGPAGPIEVFEYGDGPAVLMIPSLGRGAADFEDLAHRLALAGYHAIYPEPRGIGGSAGDVNGLTMADLAADAAAVIHALAKAPVTIVGHAFGNRVARMTATEYPHLIDGVVLLCCGGLVQPAPEHADALHRVFDVELPDDEHLAAVHQAFFAPDNDPSVWFDGWYGVAAAVQVAATTNQPVEHWWGAGGKDLLVVQPADDVMAVPENAHRICEEFGDRASMVMVPDAGHALLPEQPEAVEVVLRTWLARSSS
jgi:pimeloyl-ACP methyl ester carboxylesterase